MKLVVDKNSLNTPIPTDEQRVLSFNDVKYMLWRPHRFLRHVLRYQEAALKVYRLDSLARPFLSALLLRILSRGAVYFTDDSGTRKQVRTVEIIRYAFHYLKSNFAKRRVIREKFDHVQELAASQPWQVECSLDLRKRPLYLRTDMALGIRSGGSVGHIAGVLNNLSQFTGEPIFVTTDYIPTVDENIPQNIVDLTVDYWDFPDVLTIVANDNITTYADRIIETQDLSFIYQRYSLNNYTGVELAIKKRVPFVLEYNGSEVWMRRHWGRKPLADEQLSREVEMLNFRAADVIVVVSDPLRDELVNLGVSDQKILVNPNGVDPQRYAPDVDGSAVRAKYNLHDKTVIGFIGTFDAWHGSEVLAEAFGQLLREYPQYREKVRLLLIGDGPKMPSVKENLERYNCTRQAVLTGRVPQPDGPVYLAACDILVSPHVPNVDGSAFFGSPTKLFEYMAMERGIVASDLNQIGEILDHNRTAYMVAPGDADSLVRGLKTLVDDEELRSRLGKAAREEVIARYTWHEHTRKIVVKLEESV